MTASGPEPSPDLARRFHQHVLADVEYLKTRGYNPVRFTGLIAQKGGAVAAGKQLLADRCAKAPQVQVCYGDGLSAAAINAHLEVFHPALLRELAARGLRVGTPVFVRHSRVKVMDEIARLTDAEACVFTCGERPGLGFADSMSAYYIYRPASGATDADREVLSNINPRGFEPVKAAAVVADACVRILRDQKSGVVL